MPYHQITLGERHRIEELLVLGWHPAAIARELSRARSTITRELQRNRTARAGTRATRPSVRPGPRREARRHPRLGPREWQRVCRRLQEDWSRDVVAVEAAMVV